MQNFTLHTPTKVLFGTGQIAQLSKEIPADARILITYGGGSIKQKKTNTNSQNIYLHNNVPPEEEIQG